MQNQYKAFYDPSSIVAETSVFANKDRDERFRLVKNLQDLVYQTDDPNLSSAIPISGSKFVHISSNMVMIRSRGCNNLPIEEMLAVVRETARLRNIAIVEPDEMHILHSKKTPPEVDPVGDPMQYGAQIITSGTKKTTGTLLVCMTKVDTAQLSEQFRRHPSIAVEPLALSKSSNAKEIIPKQMQNQYDEYITKELITKQAAEHARYAKPAVSSAKKNQGRQALIDHATRASRLQKRADKSKPNKKKKLSYLDAALGGGVSMGRDEIQARARSQLIDDLSDILDAKKEFAKTAQAEIDAEAARMASEIVRGGDEETILQLNEDTNTNNPQHTTKGGKGGGKGRGKGRGKGKGGRS